VIICTELTWLLNAEPRDFDTTWAHSPHYETQ
jgi:hypothetical protein